MNNDQGDDIAMQEELTKQRMLAQKKEKKVCTYVLHNYCTL